MNRIIDFNITYNELYANVNTEIVKHEKPLQNFYSNCFFNGHLYKKWDENEIWIKLGVLHVELNCLFYSNELIC
jgi:hypothetical protein